MLFVVISKLIILNNLNHKQIEKKAFTSKMCHPETEIR